MRLYLSAAIPAAILFSTFAATAAANDWKDCQNFKNSDALIRGCTRLIQQGKLSANNLSAAYNNRAFGLTEKSEYDRAISDSTQAIRLNPRNAHAYSSRGLAYLAKGEPQRAIPDFDQAILFLKFSNFFNNRGLAYQRTGKSELALSDYNEAIKLDPRNVRAWNNRAGLWEEKRDFDRALADIDQAIRLNPKEPRLYEGRGAILRAKGDLDRAIAEYEHAVRLNPHRAESYANLAYISRARGDTDRAIMEYDRAIKLKPVASFLNGRATAYETKGDLASARADYQAALNLPEIQSDGVWSHSNARAHQHAKARLSILEGAGESSPIGKTTNPVPGSSTAGDSGRRIAMVIGNGAYVNAMPLQNPANDARAIAQNLRSMGFEVSEGVDLRAAAMKAQINAFLRDAARARVAVLFYAGHGMQIDGKNFLLPVDARLDGTSDFAAEMTDVDTILAGLDDQIRTNIVILDACRDNPLVQKAVQTVSASRSINVRSGLAAPSGLGAGATLGAGTLLAFATAPGQVALDGDGGNSPFSAALSRHISTPGLEVQQMLTRVRAEVVAATKNKQVPWSNSSLLGEVYLVGLKP